MKTYLACCVPGCESASERTRYSQLLEVSTHGFRRSVSQGAQYERSERYRSQ